MPPASMFRTALHPGVWEHKGKVAAVGIGHQGTARRWDGTAENSVGAWSIAACRKAIADAGVNPADVDGLVLDTSTTTGAHWPAGREVPMDVVKQFNQTDDPLDGIAQLSGEWIVKNMPELTNMKYIMTGPVCMSTAIAVAAQAIGDGLTHTCLVLKSWHNLDGRYYQGGANAEATIAGPAKWTNPWAGPASLGTATQFQRYMYKYGKSHDLMAPFMQNSRHNGLLFPEGYWAQHRPEELPAEDYINARWVAKPANLFDNDIPIMASAAYLFTTRERARDLKQKPVYILNHAKDDLVARGFGGFPTLEECETACENTGTRLYEGAGIKPDDLSFENMYDGFSLFHVFHLEGLRSHGIGKGDALDAFKGDISINGPFPISPSGGNVGSGRTRFWKHTDCIQQIQGRAGARQMKAPANIGVSGGPMPTGGVFTVWGSSPD